MTSSTAAGAPGTVLDAHLSHSDCPATTNAQRHAEQIQAHADFLTEYQRKSGVRIRLCSTGRYSMYDADGHFIGHTPPPGSLLGAAGETLAEVALRMALSTELMTACRLVNMDLTERGQVCANTAGYLRDLLTTLGVK